MIACKKCLGEFSVDTLKQNMYVCPTCDYHFRLTAHQRIDMTVDENTFVEINGDFITGNPLDFPEYEYKLKQLRNKLGINEAVVTGEARIDGISIVVCAMDGRFMMGSMGGAVGEKITRAVERAISKRLPLIIFSVSGGARMQEGLISLLQMVKTSGAVKKHSDEGLLYVSVLTDPTTGGVLASFAGMGDIIIAEPQAYIGFAGKRVIESAYGTGLRDELQTSEYLDKSGFVDRIVHRRDMKKILSDILKIHSGGIDNA